MRPYATIRVAIIILFLGWVLVQLGFGLVRLVEPPQRVRAPDTVAIPPHEVNPRPQMGSLPPTPPLSEAQARETLQQHGWLDIGALTQQPDGAWATTATRAMGGERREIRIDRDGHVAEP